MKIKMCGFMHAEDAGFAAKEGCDFIGINFSPLSKRCVAVSLGKEIADAARQNGAEPVAVVVNESLDEIRHICELTGITSMQLHGERSKGFYERLVKEFSLIYAIQVKSDGSFEKPDLGQCLYLYDNPQGGSGKTFDWDVFVPPENEKWILAGGLTPDNVAEAIIKLKPYGVDVASGVELGARKSPDLMKKFIQNAKGYL